MKAQYRCQNQNRAKLIVGKPLNGIDFLEVAGDQKTLKVTFVNPLVAPLTPANLLISGGLRIKGATLATVEGSERVIAEGELRVASISVAGNELTVQVNQPGDFSTYTLRLVTSLVNLLPPTGYDRQLGAVDFSFKVDCPSDFDCAPASNCPPEALAEPEINYLAKDYASFRRLLLDRLSVIMPNWQERNPADMQVALVELLAYVGDHLSYYQDAVATEAYLDSAHRRVSVRRHARLLDYAMHDGCNARTWVCFALDDDAADITVEPDKPLQLLTGTVRNSPTVEPFRLKQVLTVENPAVFETVEPAPVVLQAVRNELRFYTWGDANCCLPRGATRATLIKPAGLVLQRGQVLVFEEIKSPTSGQAEDADPSHRHAVRLTLVDDQVQDTLPDEAVDLVEIAWDAADALPFPLCLSTTTDADETISDVSVACGNVMLADHGLRISLLNMVVNEFGIIMAQPEHLEAVPSTGAYQPILQLGPLTQQGKVRDRATRRLLAFDPSAPASAALRWELRDVRPWIDLRDDGDPWTPQRDLLSSDRFQKDFVVEMENDGSAYLRFGDDILGRQPTANMTFTADYRIGNGSAGNVGAGALARAVTVQPGIRRVWNPLPATGGIDPEPLEEVRQFAPQAFRVQQRAVTPADYMEITQRRPDVQKAAATLRWTGSWYTAFVTADRSNGQFVDATFKQDLRDYLERYRLAGYDLEINDPVFVPLAIGLVICVKPGYFRSDVKAALLRTFSRLPLPGGGRGFFHPDNFTFGQPLYLSQLYAAALTVAGVDSVDVATFQRYGKAPQQEIAQGVLTPGAFEILRLDNDPNFPENGKIDFVMKGGL